MRAYRIIWWTVIAGYAAGGVPVAVLAVPGPLLAPLLPCLVVVGGAGRSLQHMCSGTGRPPAAAMLRAGALTTAGVLAWSA